ncbi:MAG: hypothetical protein Q8Q88_19400 [Phenylobacterium sp.]|uniref:hypothetical protein n=1 Tax=Phenylobacterium sp. TaxID=1871053 RepID=UPI0027354C82|nr:hypothetical protein [Phenylobacterium sp.]MDP3749208.1 hypothetical protein [Phenylobacterium sp.]
MLRNLLLAGALAALGVPAFAQAPPDLPGGGLFISPSGEPFRGGEDKAAWFAGADGDHDSVLTLAEFRADAARFFKLLDVNADGQVDGAENQRYEREIAPEITGMSFGGPRGGGRPGEGRFIKRIGPKQAPREGAARFSMLNEPQPVRGGDGDLNQRVSAEEWAKVAGRRFGLLDADGDGKLTLDTLPRRP